MRKTDGMVKGQKYGKGIKKREKVCKCRFEMDGSREGKKMREKLEVDKSRYEGRQEAGWNATAAPRREKEGPKTEKYQSSSLFLKTTRY